MKIIIKILKEKDVTKNYVKWFSDKDVTRFSNNQYKKFTFNGQKKFVRNCLRDRNLKLFGIFYQNKLIGNILLSGMLSPHKCVNVSYVVGEIGFRGKGIGSKALKKIISISKKKYKLNKLIAGLADKNIASRRILEKNQFILEGKRKKHLMYNNKYYDQLDYGLLLKKKSIFKN